MKKFNIQNYARFKNDLNEVNLDLYNDRDKLIVENIKLVENIARSFSTMQQASGVLDITDMIQEGTIGLIAAVDKIEWQTIKLSTNPERTLKSFLSKRIKGAIRRAIDINRGNIRIPEHKLNDMRKNSEQEKKMVEIFFNSIFQSIDTIEYNTNTTYDIIDPAKEYNIDILNKHMANGKYGSNVFILHKFKRQLKPRATIQLVPPNIENPLSEEFDYENFHVYVRSCILHSYDKADSNNTQNVVVMGTNKPIDNMAQINPSNKINIQPRYVNYQIYVNDSQIQVKCISKTGNSNDLILINKDSEEMILSLPIEENVNLEVGTWVLYKNGLVNQIGQNYIEENSCLFLAKIVRIISPFQYEIVFSINGTEPRPRYEKFGRPSVCEVKIVLKTELYVLRQAPIC